MAEIVHFNANYCAIVEVFFLPILKIQNTKKSGIQRFQRTSRIVSSFIISFICVQYNEIVRNIDENKTQTELGPIE